MGNTEVSQVEWGTGMRVLKMKAGSPVESAGLKAFEDFILDVLPSKKGFDLSRDFTTFVSQSEDKEITLLVLNCFSGETRHVKITPTRKWQGADSLLGLKLRAENIENAVHSVCRVTKVFAGSPASGSGIVADRDYLVGCLQFEFCSVEDFSQKVKVLFDIEVDPCLDLYFFDISSLQGRLVPVKPSNLWKGNGLLGIEFGAGLFDSRLLKEMLESRAKLNNPPLISIQTGHEHFQIKHQPHNDAHPETSGDKPGEKILDPAPQESEGSGKTSVATTREKAEGQVQVNTAPKDCYLEVIDNDGKLYRICNNSLLPSHQFPLRQFVYKA